jgi:pimeloyl-ACP methyl ester carboxylesterase
MGGTVSAVIASRHPNLIRKQILIENAGHFIPMQIPNKAAEMVLKFIAHR